MPDMTLSFTAAQAARVTNATRKLPDRQGATPPADATNAQLWAHARRVVLSDLVATVRSMEAQEPDAELDGIA